MVKHKNDDAGNVEGREWWKNDEIWIIEGTSRLRIPIKVEKRYDDVTKSIDWNAMTSNWNLIFLPIVKVV